MTTIIIINDIQPADATYLPFKIALDRGSATVWCKNLGAGESIYIYKVMAAESVIDDDLVAGDYERLVVDSVNYDLDENTNCRSIYGPGRYALYINSLSAAVRAGIDF